MIKLLLVDDHEMILEGLKHMLEPIQEMQVVGTACDGQEAQGKYVHLRPDIVLMDITMPEVDGLQAALNIKNTDSKAKIIAYTMRTDAQTIKSAISKGFSGYFFKTCKFEELVEGIRTVMAGDECFPGEVTKMLIDDLKTQNNKDDQKVDLTNREMEILKLLANEQTVKEISDILYLSEQTVHTHRKNLIRKIGAKNSAGLAQYAIKHGLIDFN